MSCNYKLNFVRRIFLFFVKVLFIWGGDFLRNVNDGLVWIMDYELVLYGLIGSFVCLGWDSVGVGGLSELGDSWVFSRRWEV